MRWALSLVLVVLFATFVSAQANVRINPGERSTRNAEYRQTVANYCRLDYDGARLSEQGWSRIQPLTNWRDNPEFHRFAVVNRYQILPDVRSERGRYFFDVRYEIAGEYDLSGGYFPGSDTLMVQIEVGDPAGDTKIVEISQSRPFVGRTRLTQWLQSKLTSEPDAATKNILEGSLQRLQDQYKKPEPGQ